MKNNNKKKLDLYKGNGIIQIQNELTPQEHKLFNFILKETMSQIWETKTKVINDLELSFSSINLKKKDDLDLFTPLFIKAIEEKKFRYKTTFKEVKEITGMTQNHLIKKSFDGLTSKLIKQNEFSRNGEIWIATFGYISYWSHNKKEELINFEFNKNLFEIIIQSIAENTFIFAKIDLAIQNKINSKHGLWLYEVCKKYIDLPSVTFSIEELRFFSGIKETQYKTSNDFMKRVINPAIEEINAKTDIKITKEIIKKGRSIVEIKFHLEKNTKEMVKEFMFRTFWTTLFIDRFIPIKLNGEDIRIKPIMKNNKIMILGEDEKPFPKSKAIEVYNYFYNEETRMKKYNVIKDFYNEHINTKDKHPAVSEDMNNELNNLFSKWKDYLTEYQIEQFALYTKGMKKEEINNLWD